MNNTRGHYKPSHEADKYAERTANENARHVARTQKILPFGKYKGIAIEKVWRIDPKYLRWAAENVAGFAEILKRP